MDELALKKAGQELQALGLREFGAPIWERMGDAPKYAGVTLPVVTNALPNGTKLSSIQIPLEKGGFISVRLAKGVPTNKNSFDIFLYTAVRDWTPDARTPNATPIKKGAITAMAH